MRRPIYRILRADERPSSSCLSASQPKAELSLEDHVTFAYSRLSPWISFSENLIWVLYYAWRTGRRRLLYLDLSDSQSVAHLPRHDSSHKPKELCFHSIVRFSKWRSRMVDLGRLLNRIGDALPTTYFSFNEWESFILNHTTTRFVFESFRVTLHTSLCIFKPTQFVVTDDQGRKALVPFRPSRFCNLIEDQ